MDAAAFEAMVRRMCGEVPESYFDGVTEVVVSPRAVPHPIREGIFTLGECIPLPLEGDGVDTIQSRVVLYHGSFRALAELDPDFDWAAETWETLTHELRHHVEWRARRSELEGLDRAAEQNFARQDGEAFDPDFHLDGEAAAPGVYHVDGDWFLDQVVRQPPRHLEFRWHGSTWQAVMPSGVTLPAFVTVEGVTPPPPGELVVVLRRKPRWRDLLSAPTPWQGMVTVAPARGDS